MVKGDQKWKHGTIRIYNATIDSLKDPLKRFYWGTIGEDNESVIIDLPALHPWDVDNDYHDKTYKKTAETTQKYGATDDSSLKAFRTAVKLSPVRQAKRYILKFPAGTNLTTEPFKPDHGRLASSSVSSKTPRRLDRIITLSTKRYPNVKFRDEQGNVGDTFCDGLGMVTLCFGYGEPTALDAGDIKEDNFDEELNAGFGTSS